MATFDYQEDITVSCPYNKVHRLAKRRLQNHLAKCPSRFDFETCNHNAEHRIPRGKRSEHELTCPDRFRQFRDDLERMKLDQAAKDSQAKKKAFVAQPMDEDDSWNRDADYKATSGMINEEWTLDKMLQDENKMRGPIDQFSYSKLSQADRKIFMARRSALLNDMLAKKEEEQRLEDKRLAAQAAEANNPMLPGEAGPSNVPGTRESTVRMRPHFKTTVSQPLSELLQRSVNTEETSVERRLAEVRELQVQSEKYIPKALPSPGREFKEKATRLVTRESIPFIDDEAE
ncbi:hypothetical protein HDE_03576 [Halotydeus destructor]|nr:hypothetical protein HDE_03576 [Halotydeus destructor]